PSKHFEYKVDRCSPLSCQYSVLLSEIDTLKKLKACDKPCDYREKIMDLSSVNTSTNIIMHFISDIDKAIIDEALQAIDEDNGYTQLLLSSARDLLK
uniref:hypothetical protein n=2 Tax=Vibrio anguillarum TaxID=55601 RepID=UPI001BE4342C